MFKYVLIIIAALILHIALYFGCELLQKNPHKLGWKIDEKIPTLYGFVYIYISWMPLMGFVPLMLAAFSELTFWRYMLAWAINMALSIAFFIIYPTTFDHYPPTAKGFTGVVCKTVFKGSFKYLNSAPSVHCSMATLFLLSICFCPEIAIAVKIAVSVLSVLIMFSTVFTKQHVLVDVVTGIPLAVVCWFISFFILK